MQSRAIQLYLSPLPAITGLHLTRLMRFPASPDGLPSTNHLLGPLQPSHLPLLFWPDRSQLHIALAVATLAACHRLRVASPEVVQRLKWRNDGGAPGEHSHQHTHHTHLFTGQATRGVTISARRHGCVVRGMCTVSANAWDAMGHSRTMQRRGDGCPTQVASDEIRWRQASQLAQQIS
jgi:hypothetical protein